MKKNFVIKQYREYKEIFSAKNFKRNSFFIIYYRENNINHSRIGLSVSKKNGNAVIRNRIKRQLRMMIDQNLDYFTNSLDLIIVVSKIYDYNCYSKNEESLKKLLNEVVKPNKKGELNE